jgi:hypothetical protein
MRKCVAAILLALYLMGTTEAYQLLKLPVLVMHYLQHKQADPELTMAAFLQLHYNEETVFDSDWAQDMQLPFKSHQENFGLLPFAYLTPQHFINIERPAFAIKQEHGVAMYQFNAGIYAADIFQPPRA